jgi:translation initiation factor IF-2
MSKIRVYDLAKKLGMENKELVEKLGQAGIEVKNHMSVLEDADVRKFEESRSEAVPEAKAPEVEVQEKRIGSGLIRRRSKVKKVAVEEPPAEEVAVAEEQPAEPVAEPAEVISAPVAETVEQAAVAPEPAVEEAVKPEPVEKEAPAAEVVEPAEAEPQAAAPEETVDEKPAAEVTEPSEAKAVPAAKVQKAEAKPKASTSRAKILGRVELPQKPAPQPRKKAAPAPAKKRADRPARPERPRTAEMPPMAPPDPDALAKEGRSKKKRKGKSDFGGAADGGRPTRRKDKREVYEPDRTDRYRKGRKASRPAKKTEITVSKAIKRKIRISDVITVGELAKRMGVKANDLIKELMAQGQMVTINHPLDYESAAILAAEFQYEVENVAFDEETILAHADIELDKEKPELLKPRPPVVTIMGHVDHGKTSLLDAIREANVTEGEAGGITQHIGAYDVDLDGRKITFLDTPGHEAFTSMRARGAQVTDIVILVVAADDGVMPQTKEAINHSKAAGVPIIVAVNKIDKPGANPDRVKQELAELDLLPEDWGGETIFVEVSAKEHTNIDQLLEMVLLQAEVMELKADPEKRAQGTVVEARLDKGRGPVSTVLVQHGTLHIGDPLVAGLHYGRVRSMTDDRGRTVKEAGPSVPVEVTGLSGVPSAGDSFHSLEDEKTAKDVVQHRQQKSREAELAKSSKISLDQLYARLQEGDVKELKIIIKADVQGSVEAVADSLSKLSTDACRLLVTHSGVGGISETDISLATASDAIVLGFNVRPAPKAAAMAELEGVDIRLYSVIYDAVNDIKSAMEGLLEPTLVEEDLGRAEVREIFHVTKVGTIAGCYVTSGKILRNASARLLRDDVVIWTGKLDSLRRFKDDVKEVATGYECGIGLENYNDIKPGDVIEAFEVKEVKTSL